MRDVDTRVEVRGTVLWLWDNISRVNETTGRLQQTYVGTDDLEAISINAASECMPE